MKKIDALILRFFQRCCHWIQDWVGIDNFTLATMFLWGQFFIYLLSKILIDWQKGVSGTLILVTAFDLFLLFLIRQIFNEYKDKYYTNQNFKNVLEELWYPMRAIFIALTLILLPHDIYNGFLNIDSNILNQWGEKLFVVGAFVFRSSIYIVSCTPKPPQKSKIKKLAEKAKEVVDTTLAPAPTLQPISN